VPCWVTVSGRANTRQSVSKRMPRLAVFPGRRLVRDVYWLVRRSHVPTSPS